MFATPCSKHSFGKIVKYDYEYGALETLETSSSNVNYIQRLRL
jgi:hypothetical protein